MGKPTGFMDYERESKQRRMTPKERIKNFDEFHTPPLKEKNRRFREHAAWTCGVPFCQSGMTTHGHDQPAVRCTIWCRSGMT